MREYAKKPESQSRTLDSNPKASRQVPMDVILQQYKKWNIQRDDLKTGIENLSGVSMDGTSCVQLYINMNGHIYDNFAHFIDAYAHHFGINQWNISDLVWDYLEYAFNNNLAFPSYNSIIQNIIPQGNFLPLPDVFLYPGSLCNIPMQGNHLADFAEAEAVSGVHNPGGYTWHHIEGIVHVGGFYRCNMVLVRNDHHAQHHIGAVSQYENITGQQYG